MTEIRVAAVVLRNTDQQILIQERPKGKIASGRWEFPGGKIEDGESPETAARRELKEELGVEIGACQPLIEIPWQYPSRKVRLYVFVCDHWCGQPQSLESQKFQWVSQSSLARYDLLPANRGIVNALRLPPTLAISPSPSDDWLTRVTGMAMQNSVSCIRLRAAGFAATEYQSLVSKFIETEESHAVSILVDDPTMLSLSKKIVGCHLSAEQLEDCSQRPVEQEYLFGGSCHSLDELLSLAQLGGDYALLSPVKRTESHPGQIGMGWAEFEKQVLECPIPVYALGGMTVADIPTAHSHGAIGVAGISAFT